MLSFFTLLTFFWTVYGDGCRTSNNEVWCTGMNQSYFDNEFKTLMAMDNMTNIEAIHIKHGKIQNIGANAFRSCAGDANKQLKKLKSLDLSYNDIRSISGQAFHCMPTLNKLNLSHNMWDVQNASHTGVFTNLAQLQKLDLTNSLNTDYSGHLHVPKLSEILRKPKFESLQLLKLGSNKLEFISDFYQKTLCEMPALKNVILSENLLHNINLKVNQSCHYLLELMDFSWNNINFLPRSTLKDLDELQKSSKKLTLRIYHQQWICDCNIIDLHNWLKTTAINVTNKDHLRCYDGHNFNKTILKLTLEEMVCVKPEDSASAGNTGVIVVTVLLVIILIAILAAVYMHRSKIQACARSVYDPIRRGGGNDHVQYSSVESTPIA
ncbi:hypothetical protein FSP39_009212 [Pinctada imbricata]|uniref:LRRCT domain-containing protein n=1 Tax=Pinctada imbricata TaxID=66713 RepID=A0AA88Y8C2_PINIB|nr:hypothetical protein FSP39_009212 [Pinctada imbricata]